MFGLAGQQQAHSTLAKAEKNALTRYAVTRGMHFRCEAFPPAVEELIVKVSLEAILTVI